MCDGRGPALAQGPTHELAGAGAARLSMLRVRGGGPPEDERCRMISWADEFCAGSFEYRACPACGLPVRRCRRCRSIVIRGACLDHEQLPLDVYLALFAAPAPPGWYEYEVEVEVVQE